MVDMGLGQKLPSPSDHCHAGVTITLTPHLSAMKMSSQIENPWDWTPSPKREHILCFGIPIPTL